MSEKIVSTWHQRSGGLLPAAYAAYAAAAAAAAEQILVDFAEHVVQILIDMKSPGREWL
jgi:hypothetical protein